MKGATIYDFTKGRDVSDVKGRKRVPLRISVTMLQIRSLLDAISGRDLNTTVRLVDDRPNNDIHLENEIQGPCASSIGLITCVC